MKITLSQISRTDVPISRCSFVNFCKQQQRKQTRNYNSRLHSHRTRCRCRWSLLKPNKRQNNKQPNEQKNKQNARLHRKKRRLRLKRFYIYLKYRILFFSQASERPGFLNPRIWLANHAHVTGPAFYDTAHGPDFFFPLNAVHKFCSWKLAVIVNLLPVLHFHRQKVNARLLLFTLKWQGKSL